MSSNATFTEAELAFMAEDQKLASVVFGVTLGFGFLTASKAFHQSRRILPRKTRAGNLYVILVWLNLLNTLAGSISLWLSINGKIPLTLVFYFWMVTLWSIQVQTILQIIINRLGLIMQSKQKLHLIRYGIAVLITLICISVYCIWIPARLGVSARYVAINAIWDRIEKVIFLIVDASLNLYFVYLVRSRLVLRGLDKYKPLLKFNIAIIAVSVALDVVIIGMMSLPNTFLYAQFHPLVFNIKLNIEMSMADLLVKVVKNSNQTNYDNSTTSGTHVNISSFNHSNVVRESVIEAPRHQNPQISSECSMPSKSDGVTGECVEKGGIMKTISMDVR